ncbi:quinolinate synthase NadA [candidate division CSSED10-310 bacterium]|uniref:Quinolinate synthase n=1 Tax=candidate division CSSED10-310 bacterium TaxID=2855610 RepID=A0ABV6Z5P0_UNCC1
MMLQQEIKALKKEKNAVILVHNYQLPEIYDVADYIGDSLELAKKAVQTEADLIVFCGVDFMAESAKILNPEKKVLLPVLEARCPMAGMVDIRGLENLKKRHPDAAVVSYINTYATTKAISYCCCTSANVVKVVNSLEHEKIIMVPDQNLALYAQRFTKKTIIPWDGYCYVHHQQFEPEVLQQLKLDYPEAEVVVHPECPPEIIDLAHAVHSTSGMMKYVKNRPGTEFIIGTEIGLIERLKRECPDKIFYSANGTSATCWQMKKNTLETVYQSLKEEQHEVTVPETIRIEAQKALDKMLLYS